VSVEPGEQGPCIEFENDEQYDPLARDLARIAGEEVRRFRNLLPSAEAAAIHLRQENSRYRATDVGIALGLAGHSEEAVELFERLLQEMRTWRPSDRGSRRELGRLYEWADELRTLCQHTARFRDHVRHEIRSTREALNLDPNVELPF
jgi:hypothetical protein